jgi:hypothetical protein
MPYIKKHKRELYLPALALIKEIKDPGELNYIFSKLALKFLEDNGENYTTYNSIIGAFECAKLELYRRKIGPMEDRKIEENGDI